MLLRMQGADLHHIRDRCLWGWISLDWEYKYSHKVQIALLLLTTEYQIHVLIWRHRRSIWLTSLFPLSVNHSRFHCHHYLLSTQFSTPNISYIESKRWSWLTIKIRRARRAPAWWEYPSRWEQSSSNSSSAVQSCVPPSTLIPAPRIPCPVDLGDKKLGADLFTSISTNTFPSFLFIQQPSLGRLWNFEGWNLTLRKPVG